MDRDWQNFKTAAQLGTPPEVPVALIVDSPWLPGWASIDTRDYFLFPEKWLKAGQVPAAGVLKFKRFTGIDYFLFPEKCLEINQRLLTRFPGAVWIPGYWVEFGMAAEPSAFGAKVRFYPDQPPAIEPLLPDLEYWSRAKPINPLEDGLTAVLDGNNKLINQNSRVSGRSYY